LKPGIVDVNPIAMSNAFSFIKDVPEDGLVVMLDIGAVSSTLVVYGKAEQFFTRDLPIGGHHFVKELSDKKEIGYIEAQDLLYRDGISASKASETAGEGVGIAERTVYDSLVEDMRRSLRFYAKQTGQSFFLKIFLTGGAACTPGLAQTVNEKLNIECAVFNPFETMAGAEELSISNPSQYTTALGLGIRGGMTSG
jgi:type IV pilus assembly protein PilM